MAGNGRSRSCGPSGFDCFSATLHGSGDRGVARSRNGRS
jgi:hypothetical protein